MTSHETLIEKRRKRLPGDKCCVACFGVPCWHTRKDLSAIVKLNIGDNRDVHELNIGSTVQKISWSRLGKPWANELTKAEACYLRQNPSGLAVYHWLEWEPMWVKSYVANYRPFPLDLVAVSDATRRPTQVSFTRIVWTESVMTSMMLKLWWLLYLDLPLIFYDFISIFFIIILHSSVSKLNL